MLYSRCGGLLRLTGRYATSRTPFLCREGVAGTGGFQLPLAGRGKEVEAEGSRTLGGSPGKRSRCARRPQRHLRMQRRRAVALRSAEQFAAVRRFACKIDRRGGAPFFQTVTIACRVEHIRVRQVRGYHGSRFLPTIVTPFNTNA